MTQPKRPISRSSTPIEFAPLILNLEPEEIEEAEKKWGGARYSHQWWSIAFVIGDLIAYLGD